MTPPAWTTPTTYRLKSRRISNPFPRKVGRRADRTRKTRATAPAKKNALLASAEKGEALIAIHTQFIADKLQQMIDSTDKGQPWPAPE